LLNRLSSNIFYRTIKVAAHSFFNHASLREIFLLTTFWNVILLSLSFLEALCTSQTTSNYAIISVQVQPLPIGNCIVYRGGSSSCQLNKLIFIGCQIYCSFESWFTISCIRCINWIVQLQFQPIPLPLLKI